MFIVKLVCDKCGTQVSTEDKFCRECGTKGTSGEVLTQGGLLVEQEVSTKSVQLGSREICGTCMQYVRTDIVHTCLNGEKAWCNNVKGVVKWRG